MLSSHNPDWDRTQCPISRADFYGLLFYAFLLSFFLSQAVFPSPRFCLCCCSDKSNSSFLKNNSFCSIISIAMRPAPILRKVKQPAIKLGSNSLLSRTDNVRHLIQLLGNLNCLSLSAGQKWQPIGAGPGTTDPHCFQANQTPTLPHLPGHTSVMRKRRCHLRACGSTVAVTSILCSYFHGLK